MTGKESSPPIISVIIPNYNHAPYLKERIESVINQSYSNFEIIILDDCSTDKSREIIESYRGHEKISHIEYNPTNSGSTFKQWQKGLNLAKGEWIWIAESDDLADNNFLHCLISSGSESCGLKYCQSNLINELNESIKLYNFNTMPDPKVYHHFSQNFEMKGKDFVNGYMLYMNSIPNASAVIFKKDLVDPMIFNLASKTKLFGDWLFWLHILKTTSVYYNCQTLNSFRFHERTVRKETHFTAVRLIEYMKLVEYLELKFDQGDNALDSLVFHYLKGEISWRQIKFKEHLKINVFIARRKPVLLIKSYLRKLIKKQ